MATPSDHPPDPSTTTSTSDPTIQDQTTAPPQAEPPSPQQDPQPDEPAPATEAAAPVASPPLPQRHTPVTPGYRAERFQLLYHKSLERVLSKLAWDNLAGCYPTIAQKAPATLKQVQAQMVDILKGKCEKEFDNIMTARQVVPKLNELERLAEEASQRRKQADPQEDAPQPPHLLPPSTILAAHLHPSLASHQSQLNARLQTTQSQNALLFEDVQRQRAEVEQLLGQLEMAVEDVKGANGELAGLVEELSREAREAERLVNEAG